MIIPMLQRPARKCRTTDGGFKEYYTDIRKQPSHISYEGIENVLKDRWIKAKIRHCEANVNFPDVRYGTYASDYKGE